MDKTVVELFAGVGGFHLGLKSVEGFEVVFANQWEPNKTKQYAYDCYVTRFPNTKALNIDISEVNNNPEQYNIPDHTVMVGGFPCQDYSVASTGAKGIEGKKGVLWWEIQKILNRKRPPFILLENVDRLLKSPASQRGRDFAVMLGCLRDLGYGVEWRVINAAEYGHAQRRRRVFIFAFHKSTNYYEQARIRLLLEGATNFIQEDGFFSQQFPIEMLFESRELLLKQGIKEISDKVKIEFGECGTLIGENLSTYRYKPVQIEPIPLHSIIQANVGEEFYLNDEMEKWEYMKGSKRIERISRDGHKYIFSEGAIAFPDPLDKPARTMLTSESSKNRSTHVIRDSETGRLRVLTPVECERLNGFEDDWTNTGMPQKFRYFCMGNALVVDLIKKMAVTLSEIINNEK